MTNRITRYTRCIALLGIVSSASLSHAQNFVANKGDLLAGFRKTGAFQGSFELVVNIGNITNFEALSPGVSISVTNFAPSQLSAAFSSYNNLQWSISSAFAGSTAWAGFPAATLWYTKARTNINSQSQASARSALSGQQITRQKMLGVGTGANTISVNLGATNANNNSVLVREPVGDPSALTAFIGDSSDPTVGNFAGTLTFNVENTTPASFTSPVRSDLYQACPNNTTDPVTGLTTGPAYYVGYFQLNPDGTMSFTRGLNVVAPPPPPVLSIARAGNFSTVSFLSTNGATYTLYFTNTAGLKAPVSTWPSQPGTLSGNNAVISFQDTTTASNRFYRVKAQ
jgi:hypothetical protein